MQPFCKFLSEKISGEGKGVIALQRCGRNPVGGVRDEVRSATEIPPAGAPLGAGFAVRQ